MSSYKKVLAARQKAKKAKEPVQQLFSGGMSLPAAGSFDGGSGSGFGGGGGGGGMPDFGSPGGGSGYNLPQPVWDPTNWTKQAFPGFAGGKMDDAQHQLTPNPFGGGVHNHFGGVSGLVNPLTGNPAVTADFTNSNNIGVQQQALAQQLAAQANGQMSPAQMMLQNQLRASTNANNLQNASMLGSAKGLNPAIAARLASQNAASNNQLAGGQAANLALGLQGQAQQQYGNMLQGWRGQDLQTELGGAQLGLENRGQNIQGANGYNNTLTQGQLGTAGIQKDYDIQQMKGQQGMFGGALNALGGIMSAPLGGTLLGKLIPGGGPGGGQPEGPNGDQTPTESGNGSAAPSGGEWTGGNFAAGGPVPGRAGYAGNDARNDKVDAKLSPGEIVIPRSITQHPRAAELAGEFVRRTLAGKGPKAKYKMADGGEVPDGEEGGGISALGGPADSSDSSALDWLLGAGAPGGGSALESAAENVGSGLKAAVQAIPGGTWQQGLQQRDRGTMDGAVDLAPDQVPAASALPKVNVNAQGLPREPGAGGGAAADPYAGVMAGYNQAFGQQEAGIRGMAGAAEKEAAGQAAAYQQYTDHLQGLEQRRQQAFAGLDHENAQLAQAYMNGKIDPQRIWANASTGNKVAAAIGIALSGIGSGLTGQPNMAMGIINRTIDQDIEAQRADLGKKQTLLSMNLQKYGRLDAAYSATAAQMHAVLQGQIGMEAAKAGGGKAAANAQMLLGQLGMQRAGQQQQVAMWNAFNQGGAGGGQGGGTPGVDAQKLRIGISGGFIPKESVGGALKEYGEFHKLQGSLGAVDQAFQKVGQLETLGERLGSPIQSKAQIDATKKIFSAQLAKDLEGRATPQDIDSIMANFPDLKDSSETVAQKRLNLQNSIKSKFSFPTLHTYGLLNQADPTIAPTMSLPGARKIQGGN